MAYTLSFKTILLSVLLIAFTNSSCFSAAQETKLQRVPAAIPMNGTDMGIWKCTAYCACVKCCGKDDGITASGKKAEYGYVACNWLPFGTLIVIEDMGIFSVQDRGAKSLFGDKKNHIKHLDIYCPTHSMAKEFGVQYRRVTILK